jgi:hypothetical protein
LPIERGVPLNGTPCRGVYVVAERSGFGPVSRFHEMQEAVMAKKFPRGRFVWYELMTSDPQAAQAFAVYSKAR